MSRLMCESGGLVYARAAIVREMALPTGVGAIVNPSRPCAPPLPASSGALWRRRSVDDDQ